MYQSSNVNTAWYIQIGTDNTHRVVLGYIQDATTYQTWVNDGSSTTTKRNSSESINLNEWSNERVEIENGVVKYYDMSVSLVNVDLTNLNESVIYLTSAQLKNIKIKPL